MTALDSHAPTDPPGLASARGLAAKLWEVCRAQDESILLRRVVELARASVLGSRCAVVTQTEVLAHEGFGESEPALAPLLKALDEEATVIRWDGADLAVDGAPVPGEPSWWIIVCRHGEPMAAREQSRVSTAAQVAAMTRARLRFEREQDAAGFDAGRELHHRALHDSLTGLPGRELLRDRADRLAAESGTDRMTAIIAVEIDALRRTAEWLTAEETDVLISAVAEQIVRIAIGCERVGARTAVGRSSGEGFLIVLDGLDGVQDLIGVAQRIRRALREGFAAGGRTVALTASIGISSTALGHPESELPDGARLLTDAELSLERARDLGGDRYEIFDAKMRERLRDEAELVNELAAGIPRGELRLLYQPVVGTAHGELASVEGLVRWEHPTRGLLAPGAFIGLAERSDLIVTLGTWVLDEACAQIRRWQDAHPAGLAVRVSVNVSARQLSPALIDVVRETLARHAIDPALLALEITETLLVQRSDDGLKLLAALKQTGVTIVLDDFGTGYSSLGYLKDFPLDQLKLDRAFCAELGDDPRSTKIVAAAIEMGRALGMTVITEGVETAEQLDVLRELGCDFVQGFYFARPEPADAIFTRMRDAYDSDQSLSEGDLDRAVGPAEEVAPVAARVRRRPPRIRRAPGSGARRALPVDISALAAHALPLAAETARARGEQVAAFGRLSGLLFLLGSVVAIPSDLILGIPSLVVATALTLLGLLTGGVFLVLPWHRLTERALYVAGAVATVEVTISALADGRYGGMLTAFYALIAVGIAYGVRSRRAIAAQTTLIIGCMVLRAALFGSPHNDGLAVVIVTALVLIALVELVVYMRERLEQTISRLNALALRDPLTGIGNHRLLHERLAAELDYHGRAGASFALLVIDIDRFRGLNERLGHAAGDDVLRQVGRALDDSTRAQDLVARPGGDEFIVLAAGSDREEAGLLAGRLRERLRRLQFAGESIDVTIGWAVFPEDGDSSRTLLAQADAQLDAARRRGVHPSVYLLDAT
jgi:diguanylate cyclase (GGDEF)-like protein